MCVGRLPSLVGSLPTIISGLSTIINGLPMEISGLFTKIRVRYIYDSAREKHVSYVSYVS